MFKRLSFFTTVFIFLPTLVWAATFPKPQGFVNDFAGVLSGGTKAQLTQYTTELKQKTGIEIAIVTLASLEGDVVESAAVELFKQWGIGQKGKDNGLLILVVPSAPSQSSGTLEAPEARGESSARIEVGYGLEGIVPDAFAGRVLREAMIPFFKKGDIDQGILMGTQVLITHIGEKEGVALTGRVDPRQLRQIYSKAKKPTILSLIFKAIMAIFMVILFIKNPFLFFMLLSMGGGRGGGGGFGGGFGGFGGGLSGGGGASARW